MTPPHSPPLPVSWEECQQRGWNSVDILLVTGDAYVDHPSFGVALIGRYLEHHGYTVAILPQPRYDSPADFLQFPAPNLFCGITAGNLDSIVANYSGNGKVREEDAYSPAGSPWRTDDKNKNNRYRPDRATLIYSNLARASYKNTPIVLGGLEASLRRFVHYDYKQGKLRASFLTDAKADLLVYGMGERAVLEIARRCAVQQPLTDIDGSCERLTDVQMRNRYPQFANEKQGRLLIVPSFSEIQHNNELFLEAELAIDKHARAESRQRIVQRQQTHWVVQHPPAPLLDSSDLDTLYSLPYSRKAHPSTPDVPALRMIRDSVTIVRGCSGNCSFCAITRHQGPIVQSRSVDSIVKECRTLAAMDDFKGTISDLGGPTANLFATSCAIDSCKRHDCLYPSVCKHLRINEEAFLDLLQSVASIENIRHVFISSGLRMELLLRTPKLLRKLIEFHLPGAMKIAPEHSSDEVLKLMHKEPHSLLKRFVAGCREISKSIGRDVRIIPYVISAHPGCTQQHAGKLAEDMAQLGLTVSKFQDFTPTPGTLSTAMYVTGHDRTNKKPIFIARNDSERKKQRQIIEERFHKHAASSGGRKSDKKAPKRRRG